MNILNVITRWLLARYPRKVVTGGMFAVFAVAAMLYISAGFLLSSGDWNSIGVWLFVIPMGIFAITSVLWLMCVSVWEFINSIVPDERKRKNDDAP